MELLLQVEETLDKWEARAKMELYLYLQREWTVPTWGTAQWGTVSLSARWEHWPCRCLRRHLIIFYHFSSIYSILFGSCISPRLGHIMVVLLLSPLCAGSCEKDLSMMLLSQFWSLPVVSWHSGSHFQGCYPSFCLSLHPTTTLKSCRKLCPCADTVLEAAGAGGHYTRSFHPVELDMPLGLMKLKGILISR